MFYPSSVLHNINEFHNFFISGLGLGDMYKIWPEYNYVNEKLYDKQDRMLIGSQLPINANYLWDLYDSLNRDGFLLYWCLSLKNRLKWYQSYCIDNKFNTTFKELNTTMKYIIKLYFDIRSNPIKFLLNFNNIDDNLSLIISMQFPDNFKELIANREFYIEKCNSLRFSQDSTVDMRKKTNMFYWFLDKFLYTPYNLIQWFNRFDPNNLYQIYSKAKYYTIERPNSIFPDLRIDISNNIISLLKSSYKNTNVYKKMLILMRINTNWRTAINFT